MATVYLARDLKHDRKVAVKVLRPELAAVLGADRFVQEIKTTASLQHPHILPLHDSGEVDGFLYYVMPYIEGETLRDKLNRETQLGIDEAVKITTEVADALDYAHRHNIIHRDIKPENILLQDGRPMVADFGIALAVSAAAGGRMTETGMSLGTPHYMSPEQATADKDLGNRSDIYSLGAVLYEMLTGDPPHTASSAQAIVMKIVADDVRPVTELRKSVPPNVAAAVAKSLEKLAADRFDTASAFAEALRNPNFTVPLRTEAGGGVRPSRGGRRALASLVVTAVLLGVVALWGWLRPRPDVPTEILRHRMLLPVITGTDQEDAPRIAVSPDRSRLVYVGPSESGVQLWVKNVDQFDATPLSGTEGAYAPFFSPDGSQVAFATGREVVSGGVSWRAVRVAGSPPVTLVDSGVGQGGGAWGSDYLYFDGELFPQGGLARVPVGGGPAEPFTTVVRSRGEQSHLWPEVLPGGRGVVFTVRRRGPIDLNEWDIAVADRETGAHAILVRGVRAQYAATGHLVYVTAEGTVMGVPFDENTLQVTGNPVALVEGVRIRFLGSMDFDLSATGTLFYTTGRHDQEIVWVRRDGVVSGIDPDRTGSFDHPRLSPDGTRLATVVRDERGTNIWIKQLEQGPWQPITSEGRNFSPDWAPDGRSLLFTSERVGGNELYVRRADASAPAELFLSGDGSLGFGSYSPNGEWVIHNRTALEGATDIYAVRTSGAGETLPLLVTSFAEFTPTFSPDGRWFAYQSDESGRFEIYVRPLPDVSESQTSVSRNGGTEPVWAPGGRELFYKDGENLLAVEYDASGSRFEVRATRVLFSHLPYVSGEGYYGPKYDVTPDGERFVMLRKKTTGEEQNELMVVENFFEELKEKVRE